LKISFVAYLFLYLSIINTRDSRRGILNRELTSFLILCLGVSPRLASCVCLARVLRSSAQEEEWGFENELNVSLLKRSDREICFLLAGIAQLVRDSIKGAKQVPFFQASEKEVYISHLFIRSRVISLLLCEIIPQHNYLCPVPLYCSIVPLHVRSLYRTTALFVRSYHCITLFVVTLALIYVFKIYSRLFRRIQSIVYCLL